MNNRDDDYTIEEIINGIEESYESIREEIREKYLKEYGKEPECFISSDHEQYWDYINQQIEEDIESMNYAEQKEINNAIQEAKRVQFDIKVISKSQLKEILKKVNNSSELIESVKKNELCFFSRIGSEYHLSSNLEHLLSVDNSIDSILCWDQFKAGIGAFDRQLEYSEEMIGSIYRPEIERVIINIFSLNMPKEELLEFIEFNTAKSEDEILDEFDEVDICKNRESKTALIAFDGRIYPYIFDKFNYINFGSETSLTNKLSSGVGISELFIESIKYNLISPSNITENLVSNFYNYTHNWILKNKIKLENIKSHSDIESSLYQSFYSGFGSFTKEKRYA